MRKLIRLYEMVNDALKMVMAKESHEYKLLRALEEHGNQRIFGDTDFEVQITIKTRHGKVLLLMEAGHTGGTPPHFVFATKKKWYYLKNKNGQWRL